MRMRKSLYAVECNHGFSNGLELQLRGGKAHDGVCSLGNARVSLRISQVKGEVIALDSPSATRRYAAQPIIAVELECVISAVGPNSSGFRALNFPCADEHLIRRWLASGKQHKRREAAYEDLR
jgi:hypothetical protein